MGFWSKLTGRPPELPPDRTVEILNRHLTRDFKVFPMAAAQLTANQVDDVSRSMGIPIPPELKAHLTGQFPGIFIEVKEEIWPRPKEFDVGPFWTFLYGLHSFTAAAGSEDWMRMDVAAAELRERTGLVAAPVLKVVGDADVYCVCTDGTFARLDHELGELKPVEGTFFDLLDLELGELRARAEKKKALAAGGGTA
jgi:hypothetical protein